MKSLKKLTALLLAAVMALAMLTACGGSGGGSNTLSEKEKYIKGINNYLHRINSSYNELVYDRNVDEQAKTYRENYEALVKGGMKSEKAKENAKKMADIVDGDYHVLQFNVDKGWSNNEKISYIGSKIKYELGDDALVYGKWAIGYVWGTNDSKKDYQPIYIVLKITNAVG